MTGEIASGRSDERVEQRAAEEALAHDRDRAERADHAVDHAPRSP